MAKTNLIQSFARSVANGLVHTKWGGITWDGDLGWHTYGGNSVTRYPGSDMNWALEAGTLWLNSVAMICAGYVFDKVVEPRVHVVYEDGEGMLQPVPKHPAAELLLNPNPEYRGNALLQAMGLSYKFDGNAYAIKVRGNSGTGVPQQLYYIPHWLMEPISPRDGGPTEFYAWKQPQLNGGFITVPVPKMNVIHLMDGLDPENPRKGLCRLKAQYRPVVSDNEIDSTIAIVLRNRGNIGAIISPADKDIEIDPDVVSELKRKIKNQSQGDARGETIYLDWPFKIDRTTQSPQDLMLDRIGERGVRRICAALSIDPAAIGLADSGQGKGGQYGAKLREARSNSYETCILPLLASIAEGMTYQLLPDFPAIGSRTGRSSRHRKWVKASNWVTRADTSNTLRDYRFAFDYSEVRELSEDADAVAKRYTDLFGGNIATLDEAREGVGFTPCEDPEVGGKFAFELLPGPAGEFGTPPGPSDEQAPPKPTLPTTDPDEEDEPDEPDENPEGDDD